MSVNIDDFVFVRREALQAILDLAVGSMDFGSGYWDHEDIVAAREIATTLGVDPLDVTPSDYRGHFEHTFKAHEPRTITVRSVLVAGGPVVTETHTEPPEPGCATCGLADDDEIHVHHKVNEEQQ